MVNISWFFFVLALRFFTICIANRELREVSIIMQAHLSKGKFYINNLMNNEEMSHKTRSLFNRIIEFFFNPNRFWFFNGTSRNKILHCVFESYDIYFYVRFIHTVHLDLIYFNELWEIILRGFNCYVIIKFRFTILIAMSHFTRVLLILFS